MPIYTFENNGRSIEHIAPMGTDSVVLDGKRWTRQPVARFGVTGFAREAELKDKVNRDSAGWKTGRVPVLKALSARIKFGRSGIYEH